jgi:4-hydroxythreonine-4-phosphate dehydrogenase
MNNPFLVVTPGDINGVGPEVTLKALNNTSLKLPVVILAPSSVYKFYSELCDIPVPSSKKIASLAEIKKNGVYFLTHTAEDKKWEVTPGEPTTMAGLLAMKSVELAADICLKYPNSAMVTAPFNKEIVNKAGFSIKGHTDYLAERDGCTNYVMMLTSSLLRVVPLSEHIPVSEVASAVTNEHIIRKLRVINNSLKIDFGIDVPRIAVLGLNPHAGDGGIIGSEENDIIEPAMKEASKLKIHVEGPFPADGFFAAKRYADYDAVLAMYHDQGLIPFKALTFNGGINFTAGLSFIRTSPDHGTAYGIAGMDRADFGSMREAIEMAQYLLRRRAE